LKDHCISEMEAITNFKSCSALSQFTNLYFSGQLDNRIMHDNVLL
jgi:hypothetical protein